MPKCFNSAHGLWREQHITTYGADFSWYVINDENAIALADGMYHLTLLVLAWTAFNAASHTFLRCVGVTHLGGMGSYTVMIITTGWVVVQTTCNGRPASVCPMSRQQAPRR